MAGTPETIVLDPAKPALERAEATQMRAKMLQESIGSVGKNIMDMVTQYQDLKIQKQKQDLASMTMAGSMVGGMDNLPQESKNKLPGILGVPLPTDEQGNVKITPDLDTVLKRSVIKLIGDDPNAAKVLGGIQEKEQDPLKAASDFKLQGMKDATEREKIAGDAAKAAADNDTKIQNTILTGQYGLSKQELANSGGLARQALANRGKVEASTKTDGLPSPFVLDPTSNTLMTEPQWYSTYPDKVMPTKLSNGDAKLISATQQKAASVAASNASVQANKSRLDAANFHLDKLIANQGRDDASKQMKLLTDAYRISKTIGGDSQTQMETLLNREIPNLMRRGGFDDESIKALGTMGGQGGWAEWALNKANSGYGYTSTDSKPSLLQPLVASIPGISPSLVGAINAALKKKGGTAQAGAATGGKTLSGDAAKQYLAE
jgi:hypothetical protein